MKKRLTAVFLILCLILPVFSTVFASDPSSGTEEPKTDYTKNESLLISYTLNADGTVQVVERWSVYCDGVPGVFTTSLYTQEGTTISDVRVFDDNAKAYVRIFGSKDKNMKADIFTVRASEDDTVQTLNIYNETTDDTFNINISYILSGAITSYADFGVFEYTAIDERRLTEEMPEILVNMITHRDLEKFSDFRLSVYSNVESEISPVNKSQTDASFTNVPAGTEIAFKVTLPVDLFPQNPLTNPEYIGGSQDHEKPNFSYIMPEIWKIFTPSLLFRIDVMTTVRTFPGGWAGIVMVMLSPVVILIFITVFSRRSAAKARTKRPFRSQFRKRYLDHYPDDTSYAQCARLLYLSKARHIDRPKYYASTILSLYSKGYISILSTKRGIRIRLISRDDEYNLLSHERLLLIFLEEALGEKKEGDMAEISEYMFYNCDKVHTLDDSVNALLDDSLIEMGHIVYESDNMIYNKVTSKLNKVSVVIYSVVMLIFAAICNFMFIMGMGKGFLVLALFVLGIVLILTSSKTPQKSITQKGEDSAARWDAYARFLNEAERLIKEDDIHDRKDKESMFLYAVAFDVNKRALRYLNFLYPWIGEDNDEIVLTGTAEGQKYSICVSRLLQFMDEFEKMTENCLKLYESEKGPFYKQKSRKRIRDFMQEKRNSQVQIENKKDKDELKIV